MLVRAGLTMARFSLAAWVGAAALFVVTGVREVTSTDPILANSPVRDALVVVRFPSYYAFGFTLVGLAAIGTLATFRDHNFSRIRFWSCIGLIVVSLGLMVYDYYEIYTPLLEMVTPAGRAKPSDFRALHESSKHVNMLDLGLLLVAALLLCWPVSSRSSEPSPER